MPEMTNAKIHQMLTSALRHASAYDKLDQIEYFIVSPETERKFRDFLDTRAELCGDMPICGGGQMILRGIPIATLSTYAHDDILIILK